MQKNIKLHILPFVLTFYYGGIYLSPFLSYHIRMGAPIGLPQQNCFWNIFGVHSDPKPILGTSFFLPRTRCWCSGSICVWHTAIDFGAFCLQPLWWFAKDWGSIVFSCFNELFMNCWHSFDGIPTSLFMLIILYFFFFLTYIYIYILCVDK